MKTSVAGEKTLAVGAAALVAAGGARSSMSSVLSQGADAQMVSSVCPIPLKDEAGKALKRAANAAVTPVDVLNSLRAVIKEKKPRRVKNGLQYGNTVITKDHIKTVAMVITSLSNIATSAPMVSRNAPQDCELYRETLKASFPLSMHTVGRHRQCEMPLQTFLAGLKDYRLRTNEYQEIEYQGAEADTDEWMPLPPAVAEAVQEMLETTPAQFSVIARLSKGVTNSKGEAVLEMPEMQSRKVEDIRAELSIEEATHFLASRLPERYGGEEAATKGYTAAENAERLTNVESTINLLKQTSEIMNIMGIPFRVPEPVSKAMTLSLGRNAQSQVHSMRSLWNSMRRPAQQGNGDIEKSSIYITAIERPSDFRAKVKDVNEVYKHIDSMVASVELYEKLLQVYEDHNLAALLKNHTSKIDAAIAEATRKCVSSKLVKIVTGADA